MKQKNNGAHGLEEPDLFSQGRPARRPKTENIGFRLNLDIFAAIAERAAVQKMSVHEYARALVIEAVFKDASLAILKDESLAEIGEAITSFQSEVNHLRQDLAFSMKTLLMTAGEVPEKEAAEWVEQNFKQ